MLRTLLAGLAALLIAGCADETEAPAAPPPALELTGRVVDAADILSPEFESEMAGRLEAFEDSTLVQLVVVTSPDLKGADIADYTRDLGNAWGIGDKDRDDGLILLVAPNQRQVRIAVGLGLEKTVTDHEADVIVQRELLPRFRDGDFEAGIDAGVDSLIGEITPTEMKEAA